MGGNRSASRSVATLGLKRSLPCWNLLNMEHVMNDRSSSLSLHPIATPTYISSKSAFFGKSCAWVNKMGEIDLSALRRPATSALERSDFESCSSKAGDHLETDIIFVLPTNDTGILPKIPASTINPLSVEKGAFDNTNLQTLNYGTRPPFAGSLPWQDWLLLHKNE